MWRSSADRMTASAKGVAGGNLRAGGRGEHLLGLPTLLEGKDIDDDRAAQCQCAGRVEDHRVDLPGSLQMRPALIRMPCLAPLPVGAPIAVGVARVTAHGQASSNIVIALRTSRVTINGGRRQEDRRRHESSAKRAAGSRRRAGTRGGVAVPVDDVAVDRYRNVLVPRAGSARSRRWPSEARRRCAPPRSAGRGRDERRGTASASRHGRISGCGRVRDCPRRAAALPRRRPPLPRRQPNVPRLGYHRSLELSAELDDRHNSNASVS